MTWPWHHHRANVDGVVRLPGVDHVGEYEVCRCRRVRMEGDRRWRYLPRTTVRTVR